MTDPRFDLPLDEWTPIGAGIQIKPILGFNRGDVVGFNVRHFDPPGWCVGAVTFARWTVTQERPLTLTPSIQCSEQGHAMHGFIRDGRWVSA